MDSADDLEVCWDDLCWDWIWCFYSLYHKKGHGTGNAQSLEVKVFVHLLPICNGVYVNRE